MLIAPLLSSQCHVHHELFSSCSLPCLGCVHSPNVGRHATKRLNLPLTATRPILLSIPITSSLPCLSHLPGNPSFILTPPSNVLVFNVFLSHIPHCPHYPSNSHVHLIFSQMVQSYLVCSLRFPLRAPWPMSPLFPLTTFRF